MTKEDWFYASLLFGTAVALAVAIFLIVNSGNEARDYRTRCTAAGGTPLISTNDYGNVCVDGFIVIDDNT
jgi:hypothetical protein